MSSEDKDKDKKGGPLGDIEDQLGNRSISTEGDSNSNSVGSNSQDKIDVPEFLQNLDDDGEVEDLDDSHNQQSFEDDDLVDHYELDILKPKKSNKSSKSGKSGKSNRKEKKPLIKKRQKSKKKDNFPEVVVDINEVKKKSGERRKDTALKVYECCRDEPWNIGVQIMLMKVSEKTMGYRWMHEVQKKRYDTLDFRYSWIGRLLQILLGTIGSGGMIATLITLLNDHLNGSIYLILSVGVIEAVLYIAYNMVRETHDYQNFQEKIYRNEQASRLFGVIHLDIQQQLALRKQDRRNDREFLTQMMDKYNDIKYQAPILDDSIVKKYLKATKNKDFTLPINFQDGDNFKIYVDPKKDGGMNIGVGNEKRSSRRKAFKSKSDFENRYQYEMMRFLREL